VIEFNLLVTAVTVFAACAMAVNCAMLVVVMRVVVGLGFIVGHVRRRMCRVSVFSGIEVECQRTWRWLKRIYNGRNLLRGELRLETAPRKGSDGSIWIDQRGGIGRPVY
jgi:hypothetical protein